MLPSYSDSSDEDHPELLVPDTAAMFRFAGATLDFNDATWWSLFSTFPPPMVVKGYQSRMFPNTLLCASAIPAGTVISAGQFRVFSLSSLGGAAPHATGFGADCRGNPAGGRSAATALRARWASGSAYVQRPHRTQHRRWNGRFELSVMADLGPGPWLRAGPAVLY